MARTKSLRKLGDSYIATLDNAEATWAEVKRTERRKAAAEDIFLRMVVGWEEFVSDWFIGALNHDATRYKANQEQKLAEWLRNAIDQSEYARFADCFRPPKLTAIDRYPPVATVRRLLDPDEKNIEFRTFQHLLKRSTDCHASKFISRIAGLKAFGGDEIIDAALAIRNVLAHRSTKALRTMNERVAAFSHYPALQKKIMSKDGIGTYLAARTPAGMTRRFVLAASSLLAASCARRR